MIAQNTRFSCNNLAGSEPFYRCGCFHTFHRRVPSRGEDQNPPLINPFSAGAFFPGCSAADCIRSAQGEQPLSG